MTAPDELLDALLEAQRAAERGPRREGLFATWLVVRVALDVGLATGPADRAERKRVELLRGRVATMALPRPLARGMGAVLDHLAEATPAAARIALAQLTAPVRDALGPAAAEAVAGAARLLHDHQLGAPS